MNRCYRGWAESLKSLHGKGGNGSRTPAWRVGGLLWATLRLDYYGLVTLHPGLSYMARGPPDWEGWFVEVGHGFPYILLGSRALRWTMTGMVISGIALWHRLSLVAKLSHVVCRCGQDSLPSATSYDLQSSVEGTKLPVRRCFVPSCGSGWWRLSKGGRGMKLPAWIFDGVLTI
jgi:hypothetical protein